MASSSSYRPSHSTATSSSQSWTYDVFLSFRGQDTRKTFVDHLYSALDQQGIYTYKDDETLPRGKSIGSSLLKAIKESQIAVIVFSKNYADSSWCLDELAYIMQCMNERGLTVFPIFYDVDPSDVRKQKGEFGKAFSKQELENKDKVESWRKALVGAANVSGWEPKYIANGHESKCIEEIVDTISLTLYPLTSSANGDLIGIDTRMQDLKSRLGIELGGVCMVGIWGVGGSGKSTLAFSVYEEISNEFDGCCFVENVREESSKFGLAKLQEKLLLGVLKLKQVVVGSVEEGRRMIKRRLRRKNVLIVLDDVDHLDQLRALAGSHDWFDERSRIIITTRDNHLLNAHKVNVIYNISLLNDDEAIQLFCRHAPRDNRPLEDYETLSQDVVSYAGGLPLALKVLGSFLCDKDLSEWRSALARLKDIPDTDIVEKLKISYDGLKAIEKELFLDIACFFRRCPKDEAMMILDACGFHPVIGVKVLIQKALVSISNGSFDMHDLVQEMGHYIVRGENPNNPEIHSRIWREEDVLNLCVGDAMTNNDNIKVLKTYSEDPRLPHVVANMKKLRWISWRSYPASSLPTNFQPTKLCCLILEHGLQIQLWKGCKRLPNLKVLHLTGSENLIVTPDFDGLPNLERLTLSHCSNLKEIHPTIGYHERLVFLDLSNCSKLKMFPTIFWMKKLETLDLSWCSILCKFPEIQNKMDSLEHLDLSCSGIESVPSSIGQYCTNLVSLDLDSCTDVKSIEGNFRFLKDLRKLSLTYCIQLEKLPEDFFDVECCLEELSLPPNKGLVGLVSTQLPRFLRKLDLNGLNLVDGDIPSDIGELSNLQVLYLCGNDFSQLPSSLLQLPQLKVLDVSNCYNLAELMGLPSSITVFKAVDCNSLEISGDFLKCKWLWKVTLWRKNKQCVIGGDKVLQSMLQGNAIENYIFSLILPRNMIPKEFVPSLVRGNTFTLHLPHNWYNDFSGFLMCAATVVAVFSRNITIIMKKDMGMDSQFELWNKSDETPEPGYHRITWVGYVSFSSLRHTAWWNSTYNTISFYLPNIKSDDYENGIGVGLVPRKSKGDLVETTIDCSEFWDEEFKARTFTIEHDSKSSIQILCKF